MQTKSITKRQRGIALTALAASCAIWSNPALAADEYVTEGVREKCRPTDAVFKSSSGAARLDIYEGTTDLEAWGFGMDFANGISDNNSNLTASIAGKHSGPDNARRSGCPTQGSIDLKLVSPTPLTAAATADVTVRFPTGTWRLPVTVHPIVINTIRWNANATLATCLAQNGGSLTVVNETRVVVRVPAMLPRNTCSGSLLIIANLVPNSLIDAKPDQDFLWKVLPAGSTAAPQGTLRSALAAPDLFGANVKINEIPIGTAASERTFTVSLNGTTRKTLALRTEVLPPPPPPPGTANLVPVATGAPFRSVRTADGRFPLAASFCAGVAAGSPVTIGMPVIRWGVRLAAGNTPSRAFIVRLVNADSGAVIETLTVSTLSTNLPEQAKPNYDARFSGTGAIPTQIAVENVGGQCLLRTDTTRPGFRFEPLLRVEVDAPTSVVPETSETDNNRTF